METMAVVMMLIITIRFYFFFLFGSRMLCVVYKSARKHVFMDSCFHNKHKKQKGRNDGESEHGFDIFYIHLLMEAKVTTGNFR